MVYGSSSRGKQTNDKQTEKKEWGNFSFYTLKSICMFSMQFSVHLPRCWQREFVKQSRAYLGGDHCLYSCDLDVWCRGDFVRRSEMLRFKALKRNLSYLILSSGLVPKSSREGKTRKARLVWVSKRYRSGNYRGGKIFRGGKSNWRRGKQRTWCRRRLKRNLFASIFIQYHWARFWQWSYNNIQTRITKPSSLIMPTSI